MLLALRQILRQHILRPQVLRVRALKAPTRNPQILRPNILILEIPKPRILPAAWHACST
jgi:hypothetical protein